MQQDWDKIQDKLGAHFLQRQAWGKFKESMGEKVIYQAGAGWSWLAIIEKSRFGVRLYCPYGPTAQSLAALKHGLESLILSAKEFDATYLRVDPQGPFDYRDLAQLGLTSAHRNIQPRYTWVKELSGPEEQIINEMSATNRNLYRTADKKGLSFKCSQDSRDIAIFLPLMHEVAGRNGIVIHGDTYYQKMAETLAPLGALKIYIAYYNKQAVAAGLVFDSPTTRYYAHAGAQFSARKLHPGSPLVSKMILDAKANGQQFFDFYGIAPPDEPRHPWTGITNFKKSFGGQAIDMHGSWELPVKKHRYQFYRFLQNFIK